MQWSWRIEIVLGIVFLLTAVSLATAEETTLSQTISLGACQTGRGPDGDELTVPGLGSLLVPGKPKLPSRIYALAVPPGATVAKVTFDVAEGIVLPGTYRVRPAPLPRVIGQEDPALAAADQRRYQENFEAAYGSDAAYPAQPVELVRPAAYRNYNLADVRVTPFDYRPLSGRLTYYPEVTIHVHYTLPDRRTAAVNNDLPRPERVAQGLILNYEAAQPWYGRDQSIGRGLHDYVIITLDSLVSAVTPLVDWETSKGRTVSVVTTSWINTNYTGYDLAEKMRNFLRANYPWDLWGIEDVLLVGHYDDVPMRRTEQNLGYGKPETDFYYAELSLPDNQSWDADQDQKWGEDSDPIDFYNEVNVGRIPWSDSTNVAQICQKSIAYEQNNDVTFKKNILLLGAFFWTDTDNARLMEAKINQPWMADWTFTRMYEQNSTVYSTFPCDDALTHDNVMAGWSTGTYAFVNWAGHGSPTSAHIMGLSSQAFIASSDCVSLNDDYPAIIFADACSNADTDELNIGQAMMQQGGVGFVGATKVALGCPGWVGAMDGSSQSLDYFFTTLVTSGDYSQGAAHQQALRNMYTFGLWGYDRYETFEWGALFGNPNLSLEQFPTISITIPDGVPDLLPPGEPTTLTVQIINGTESYVPGTGYLCYRYAGGAYLTSPLVHDTDDFYQATLPPAACEAAPEYYFVVQGDGGTTAYNPINAPAAVHVAVVGAVATVVDHDFETAQGWIAGATGDTATAGQWERGDPEATTAQPGDDHTPAPGANCFVTGRPAGGSTGAYDVDGGYTTLLSPLFDLSDHPQATIGYWRWYSNNKGAAPGADVFTVDISSDGGSTWTNVEIVGPTGAEASGGWYYHEFIVGDFVPLTNQIRMRFIAADEGTGSLVEALVDDFLIKSLSCVMPVSKGDLNCDGAVNLNDVDPFVLALLDPAFYAAAYPLCDVNRADCNDDALLNGEDIASFVSLLLAP